MQIVALYASDKEDKKHSYSSKDKVERAGYVPNDQKIDTFISSGMMLMDFHANASEYDIPETESQYEQDTKEYLEELTEQAEKYDNPPLSQFMDKITANEVLSESEMVLKESEKISSSKKSAQKEKTDTEKIVLAITDGFKNLKEKADLSPKE